MHIGGIIRAQMDRKKLHQKELADKLNVDQRTISNYCNNKTFPDLETLSLLCEELDIDIRYIMDLHENNSEHLLIKDESEMHLLNAYRSISDKNQKEFLESFLTLANLLKD